MVMGLLWKVKRSSASQGILRC